VLGLATDNHRQPKPVKDTWNIAERKCTRSGKSVIGETMSDILEGASPYTTCAVPRTNTRFGDRSFSKYGACSLPSALTFYHV